MAATNRDTYLRERGALLEGERRARTGGALTLDPLERRLNDTLMQWKRAEIERGYAPYGTFPPAEHFFRARPLIEASPIFKLIQKMPKGMYSSIRLSKTKKPGEGFWGRNAEKH